MSAELILDTGSRISLQSSLLAFLSYLRLLLVELPLEASKHLEKLPFERELGFVHVGPYLRRNNREKEVFPASSM